jgi:hypothetical protein
MICNVWYVKVNVVDEVPNGRPAYIETLATQGMLNQSYTPLAMQ